MRNHTKLNITDVWQCNFKQGPIYILFVINAVTATLPKNDVNTCVIHTVQVKRNASTNWAI